MLTLILAFLCFFVFELWSRHGTDGRTDRKDGLTDTTRIVACSDKNRQKVTFTTMQTNISIHVCSKCFYQNASLSVHMSKYSAVTQCRNLGVCMSYLRCIIVVKFELYELFFGLNFMNIKWNKIKFIKFKMWKWCTQEEAQRLACGTVKNIVKVQVCNLRLIDNIEQIGHCDANIESSSDEEQGPDSQKILG